MKFVVASYGSRGDIEPSAAAGLELLRRGHEVRMAVPPDLVGFAESAGLAAVAYGVDTREWLEVHRDFWNRLFRSFWRVQDLRSSWQEVWEPVNECWEQMTATLMSLSDGADLLFTGLSFEQPAANVAEYYDIPLATLHYHPMRPNGQFVPFLPAPLVRFALTMDQWVAWGMTKKLEDAQRRKLGLPKATSHASRRIIERGSLEIQAYDEVCYPGLAAEWAKWNGPLAPSRPFVGTLTMELPTDADEEIAAWIDEGTPPIFFGFGSIAVESAPDTLAMISAACEQMGERALVCAGWSDFSDVPRFEHVKVVGTMNYAAVFPACRAVVHHGGAGTTAAGLRAGVPTLILWTLLDDMISGARVKRLKVGTARRLSTTTRETLVTDLRTILASDYVARAQELAARMTKPADSAAATADLLEEKVRLRRVC
ncbi:glycosyl transferase family 1 [Mycobacterium sp. 1164966.3]|uniref:glycosyltransferase n=1 Tax=Mycobacterium sp. 1164966.3 TaxID=1856861 RepID=UPI0007FC5BBC|nr:glycosyltransferase [Mycobacterium sp. 1164966.3]OBA84271.1 glycosyl transferase family 1 [Mycobacterium sp. 1164966.3]